MENKTKAIITILLLMILLEAFCICLAVDIINDKNAYIRGLQSDRNVCNGKLDSIKQDYERLSEEVGK